MTELHDQALKTLFHSGAAVICTIVQSKGSSPRKTGAMMLVDEKGTAVILKNNVPRYLVIEFSKAEENAIAPDEDVLAISKRLLKKNKEAYEVLAK